MIYVEQFKKRLHEELLPTYCNARNYQMEGFREESVRIHEVDARDCLIAIDSGLVKDKQDGKFRAPRNSAHEVLFWEGAKGQSPRPITLWLEPCITFAALARLHFRYGWGMQDIGSQPEGWAFDLATYLPSSDQPHILGEVKKTISEVELLKKELVNLSINGIDDSISNNSLRKWIAIQKYQPEIVWLLGPSEHQYIYKPHYSSTSIDLVEASVDDLHK